MRHTQLTDEITALKQLKRRLEDAKAEGNCRSVALSFCCIVKE